MNKILICCKTGWQFPGRRRRCLDTWKGVADYYSGLVPFDAVFTFGVREIPHAERIGDCVFLPAPNDYHHLPQRMRECCRWAITEKWWDYIFFMDDDTRLDVDRLVNYDTKGTDYVGPEWKPGVGYASGGGHLLSRRGVEIVACNLKENVGADDLLVGRVLKENGIFLTVDNDRFKVLMPIDAEPGPDNDWVYATPNVREPY